MEAIRKAKASRRAHVMHLNRHISDAEGVDAKSTPRIIAAIREKLLCTKGKLEDLGATIIEHLDDEEEVIQEVNQQEELSEKIIDAITKLDSLRTNTPPDSSSASSDRAGLEGLPRISPPSFSGDF